MFYRLSFLLLFPILLTGCLSSVFTGASVIYNRHSLYKQAGDMNLSMEARHLIFHDYFFKQKNVILDILAFNGDILLAGHVPNTKLLKEAEKRIHSLKNVRRRFIQVSISSSPGNMVLDSWISAKIKSQIVANSEIDPNLFKIMTIDAIVYVMGDVPPKQGKQVLDIARNTPKVKRVVTLLRYYRLTDE